MTTTWLVIASTAKALVYDISKKNQPALLIRTLTHSASKMKDHELASDRPGQFYSSGATHGSHVAGETPHQLEQQHFALELEQFLTHEYDQNHFTALIVTAEPHFYGLFTNELAANVKKTIKQAIHKNYLSLPDAELEQWVSEVKHDSF